ncbi:hypothetical protein CANCADRAFT_1899 [Tortispora caseinolytica NRRL Y-17796]|uniref:t-SNARE coiled-coil homology domain-containing protein n=1 Tax=Tortispora caseinolytica NRRL Y-17796 TaxID=767744 RepID=A0A1E4TEI8_9ASCO|nr:hypothetical protein CANCADRAFT_1899 [Tortispora caseinolytica NRRL Y-17796]
MEISILSTGSVQLPTPHIVYNISVKNGENVHKVSHRYSDFVVLNNELSHHGIPLPSLPPKVHLGLGDKIEKRREGLERYLKIVVTLEDGRLLETSTLRAFLNLPTDTRRTSDVPDWLEYYRSVKTQLHNIRRQLVDQRGFGGSDRKVVLEAKTMLIRSGRDLSTLEAELKASTGLGPGELRRRRELYSTLLNEKNALDDLLRSIPASAPQTDTAYTEQASASDRHALFQSNGADRPRRVIGKPAETAETRIRDNTGLLELQKTKINEQDEQLEDLHTVIARQKQLGIDINSELELHNAALDQIDSDMDIANRKLKKGSKAITRFT